MPDITYKGSLVLNEIDATPTPQVVWFGCTDPQAGTLGRLAAAPTSYHQCLYSRAFEKTDKYLALWIRTKKVDTKNVTFQTSPSGRRMYWWPGLSSRRWEQFGNLGTDGGDPQSLIGTHVRGGGEAGYPGPWTTGPGAVFSPGAALYDNTEIVTFGPVWSSGTSRVVTMPFTPFAILAVAWYFKPAIVAADGATFEVEAQFSSW